jgi:hypothetical protein
VNAGLAAVLGALIVAVATVAPQLVASRNNFRQTREDRSENRRTELSNAIRDLLAEAQDLEHTVPRILHDGQRPPDASTDELWLRQKIIQVLSKNEGVRQTSLNYSYLLHEMIWITPVSDLQKKGEGVWGDLTAVRNPFLDAAGKALTEAPS